MGKCACCGTDVDTKNAKPWSDTYTIKKNHPRSRTICSKCYLLANRQERFQKVARDKGAQPFNVIDVEDEVTVAPVTIKTKKIIYESSSEEEVEPPTKKQKFEEIVAPVKKYEFDDDEVVEDSPNINYRSPSPDFNHASPAPLKNDNMEVQYTNGDNAVQNVTELEPVAPVEPPALDENPSSTLTPHLRKLVNDTIHETITAEEVIREHKHFSMAKRIEYEDVTDEIIDEYLFKRKEPLVISNTLVGILNRAKDKKTPAKPSKLKNLFGLDFLKMRCGDIIIRPRDNLEIKDLEECSLGEYVEYLSKPESERDPKILYGKDIECPEHWTDFFFTHSKLQERFKHKGKEDLMSDLPAELQAITLMIYIGDKKTYTPAHRDVVGSLGHNIMVWTDPADDSNHIGINEINAQYINEHKLYTEEERKKQETYALWCVLSPKEIPAIRKFWKEKGNDMDEDNCFLPLSYLKDAPFNIQLIEQRIGDFVLVPPNAPHQVVNRGGRSVKVAWNTITTRSLSQSILALPNYRNYGKHQVYRVKAIAFHALKTRMQNLETPLEDIETLIRVVEYIRFSEDIEDEQFAKYSTSNQYQNNPDDIAHSHTCNHCKCDIFNRCYHCSKCDSGDTSVGPMMGAMAPREAPVDEKEGYDLCLDCVAEGRTCQHVNMTLRYHLTMEEIDVVLNEAKQIYLKRKTEKGEQEQAQKLLEDIKVKNQKSCATIAFNNMYWNMQSVANIPHHTCHQCTGRPAPALCSKCNACENYYCETCLWDRYHVNCAEVKRNKLWKCPACADVCNCDQCLDNRGINTAAYNKNIMTKLDQIKEVLPFNVKNVGAELEQNQLSAVTDHSPNPVLRAETVAFGALKKEQRIYHLINKSAQKIRIITSSGAKRELKCTDCQKSCQGAQVIQHRVDRRIFCLKCFEGHNNDEYHHAYILFNTLCDNCHSTIVGIKFSTQTKDYCHDCYAQCAHPKEEFHVTIPDYGDAKSFAKEGPILDKR